MLENKKTEVQRIHYSRYTASLKNDEDFDFGEMFVQWLRSNYCTEQEVQEIAEMATSISACFKCFVQKMGELLEQIVVNEEGL